MILPISLSTIVSQLLRPKFTASWSSGVIRTFIINLILPPFSTNVPSDSPTDSKTELEKKIDKLRSEKELKVEKQLFEEAAIIRDKERKLLDKLSNEQQSWNEKSKLEELIISSENIADVVSLITGIPVNKVAQSESQKLLNLPKSLSQFIIGQEKYTMICQKKKNVLKEFGGSQICHRHYP